MSIEQLRNLIKTALQLESSSATAIDSSRNTRLLGETDVISRLRQQITKLARSPDPAQPRGASARDQADVARRDHAHAPPPPSLIEQSGSN